MLLHRALQARAASDGEYESAAAPCWIVPVQKYKLPPTLFNSIFHFRFGRWEGLTCSAQSAQHCLISIQAQYLLGEAEMMGDGQDFWCGKDLRSAGVTLTWSGGHCGRPRQGKLAGPSAEPGCRCRIYRMQQSCPGWQSHFAGAARVNAECRCSLPCLLKEEQSEEGKPAAS